MLSLWRWLIAFLTWLSMEPNAMDREAPRSAAAVAYAYASLASGDSAPAPAPPSPAPSGKCACGCRDGVWKPDGKITEQCPCPASCPCKAGKCPDGRCPPKR
jgi:hypothetical protein